MTTDLPLAHVTPSVYPTLPEVTVTPNLPTLEYLFRFDALCLHDYDSQETITDRTLDKYQRLTTLDNCNESISWIGYPLPNDRIIEDWVVPPDLYTKDTTTGEAFIYWIFQPTTKYNVIASVKDALERTYGLQESDYLLNPLHASNVSRLIQNFHCQTIDDLAGFISRHMTLTVIDYCADFDWCSNGDDSLGHRSNINATNLGPLSIDDLNVLSELRRFVPAASHDKNGYEHKLVALEDIHKYSHWSMETSRWTAPWIAVDLDCDDSLDRMMSGVVPTPSFIIANNRTGHAQAFWKIIPVCKTNAKMTRFYNDVRLNLTRILDGDEHFTNHRVQNPYWDGIAKGSYREVYVPDGCARQLSLTSLYKWMVGRDNWIDSRTIRDEQLSSFSDATAFVRNHIRPKTLTTLAEVEHKVLWETFDKGSRNVTLFKLATWLQWHGGNPDLIREAKCVPEFPSREFDTIINSVRRYYKKKTANRSSLTNRKKSKVLSSMGRKGGKASTLEQNTSRTNNLAKGARNAKLKAADDKRRAYIINLLNSGKTKTEVAQLVHVSRQTLYAYLKSIGFTLRNRIADDAKGREKEWNALESQSNDDVSYRSTVSNDITHRVQPSLIEAPPESPPHSPYDLTDVL
jgi:hypothetical protein